MEAGEAVGDDLLWRRRHGRILLKRRWIHFPLRPLDLIAKLPKRFAAALAFDAISKPLRRKNSRYAGRGLTAWKSCRYRMKIPLNWVSSP